MYVASIFHNMLGYSTMYKLCYYMYVITFILFQCLNKLLLFHNINDTSDMDEWSYALLTCKIFLRGYETGSIIFEKGAPSDYAYIILHGSVRVSVNDDDDND